MDPEEYTLFYHYAEENQDVAVEVDTRMTPCLSSNTHGSRDNVDSESDSASSIISSLREVDCVRKPVTLKMGNKVRCFLLPGRENQVFKVPLGMSRGIEDDGIQYDSDLFAFSGSNHSSLVSNQGVSYSDN